jgi:hypothetical protein
MDFKMPIQLVLKEKVIQLKENSITFRIEEILIPFAVALYFGYNWSFYTNYR